MWNLGSLVLGLMAWGLPILLARRVDIQRPLTGWGVSLTSMGCCILSLFLQLLEVRRRTQLQDWSALMDTMGAVVMSAGILILVTVLIHVGLWLTIRSEQKK